MGPIDALSRALGLGPPEPVLAALRTLYAELDADIEARTKDADLPCAAGCDACCRESVFVSAPEFLAVCDLLASTRTPSELSDLQKEMERLAETFTDELEMLESFEPGPERDEVAARVKFDCPLLEDGRCSVYSARELNARTFGASWDGARDEVYGCTLTVSRLAVIGSEVGRGFVDAREARARLVRAVPGTERVHVYPWWFAKYGRYLLATES